MGRVVFILGGPAVGLIPDFLALCIVGNSAVPLFSIKIFAVIVDNIYFPREGLRNHCHVVDIGSGNYMVNQTGIFVLTSSTAPHR